MSQFRVFVVVAAVVAGVTVGVLAIQRGDYGAPEVKTELAASGDGCQMADVQPSSGQMVLTFVRASTQNSDRNDYRLTTTLRWDSQAALDCFDDGNVDWAYEHDILYNQHFDRKLWNENLSGIPSDAGPYIDTTVADRSGITSLSFGIFRPERLRAGVDYKVEFDLFLPNHPPGDVHPLTLEGEILEKNCGDPSPWCVGSGKNRRDRQTFIGEGRGFSVSGDCWTWTRGSSPGRCSSGPIPTQPPVTSPPATSPPATSPSATSPPATSSPARPPATSPPQKAPAGTSAPATSPPVTSPPATSGPTERVGTVNGCNTYGQHCEGNPIYRDVPPDGYNFATWPKIATVNNGTQLTARCWGSGGVTWNYAALHNPPDYGPNPYDSTIYFYVRAPDGQWGYIPDTYFVRDKVTKLGLPAC